MRRITASGSAESLRAPPRQQAAQKPKKSVRNSCAIHQQPVSSGFARGKA
ncbi:hypothetical protein [Polaromonas sp.]|nr:hypothetical protein [Burkholderiales bacterium]